VGLKSESYKQDLEKYLLGIDAKIVGELSEIAEYQILLNECNSVFRYYILLR